jgi:hypothetical protein
MAMMPLWWEQKLQLQQQLRCLRIDGNKASLMMSNKGNNIDDNSNAIATRATTPAWGWQGCHCNEGNNAITNQGQWHHCYDGNDTCALTMATTSLSWGQQPQLQQQQRYLSSNGNDAIAMRATMPAWWQATKATALVWQWQRRLCIGNGNNTIVTRATIAIATTAKTPAHQRQQCNYNEGYDASLTTSNKGNNTCMRTHNQTYHMFVFACTLAKYQMFELASQLANLASLCWQCMTNKPLAPPPPLALQHLCAEIGVNCLCQDKKAPTTVMLVLQ